MIKDILRAVLILVVLPYLVVVLLLCATSSSVTNKVKGLFMVPEWKVEHVQRIGKEQ